MTTISVLYDTSYLMAGDGLIMWGSDGDFNLSWPFQEYFVLEHIVPEEVKKEIASHFGNPEKDKSARKARTTCAEILALPNHKEVSLAALEPVEPIERILGPDSPTDKRILAEAWRLSKANPKDFVFIATHDGGIKIEAALWNSKLGMQIFTPSNRDSFVEALVSDASPKYETSIKEAQELREKEQREREQEKEDEERARKEQERIQGRQNAAFAVLFCAVVAIVIAFLVWVYPPIVGWFVIILIIFVVVCWLFG